MTFAQNINDGPAEALLLLLEVRERLGQVFDDWSDLDDVSGDHELAAAADAYREIDDAIRRLGGPTMEAVYGVQNTVMADIPDDIENRTAVGAAIFRHCAAVAAR